MGHDHAGSPLVKLVLLGLITQALCSGRQNDTRLLNSAYHVSLFENLSGYVNWQHPEYREHVQRCSQPCSLDLQRSSSTDAIIVHAVRFQKSWSQQTRFRTAKNEKVVFFSMEQPKYAPILNKPAVLQMADIVATYVQNRTFSTVANFPLTYFPLHIFPADVVLQAPVPFGLKDGFGTGVSVVAFVSNCANAGATQRTNYLRELMEYIPVHNYGNCLNTRQGEADASDVTLKPVRRRVQKLRTLQKYKFYLAFENDLVPDYVSEKLYEGYIAGTVPVYRGSRDVNHLIPSPDSIINAYSLTPRELADKLIEIAADERLYNQYLKFKSRPLAPHFVAAAMRSYTHPNVICRMCHYFTTGRDPTDNYDDAMKYLSLEQLPAFKAVL